MAQTAIHKWQLPEGTARPVVHTDMKALADQMDGQVPFVCTSTTRPAHATGLIIFETDTKRTRQSDGTKWRILSQPWRTYTPEPQGFGTSLGSGSVIRGWYEITGDETVHALFSITFGTGATAPPTFPYIAIGIPYPVKDAGDDNFLSYVSGEGAHVWDGYGGAIRKFIMTSSPGASGFQVFAWPNGGATMNSLTGAGYPFKAGTVLSGEMTYRAAIPE